MTNPDELERRLQEAADASPGSHAGYAGSGWIAVVQNDLRLILAANRKMREAIERLMDAEFAKDWRTWSDDRARLLLGVGPRFDAFMEARSALSTKETGQ